MSPLDTRDEAPEIDTHFLRERYSNLFVQRKPRTLPDTPHNMERRRQRREHYYNRDIVEQWAQTTISNCRARAARRGIECLLTIDDLKDMLIECRMICPILGIELRFGRGMGHASDHSISIDRIDNDGPYSKDNCILLSHKANTARSRLTLAELDLLGQYAQALRLIHQARKLVQSLNTEKKESNTP